MYAIFAEYCRSMPSSDPVSLDFQRALAADALIARETDRLADALTPPLTAFHDTRVHQSLIDFRSAWEACHGRTDRHGEATAEVLQLFHTTMTSQAMPHGWHST